jgi:protein O-GlcNAc transferase
MAAPLPSANDESVVAEAARCAVTFHQHGMPAEAEKFCAAILDVRPDHFDALHLLGTLRRQQGRNAEAAQLIAAALKMNPRSVDALCDFGAALNALDRHDEALAAYDQALVIKPDHLAALISRGHVLEELGRGEEAAGAYRNALDTAPRHVSALNNHGNALLLRGRTEEAIAAFEKAVTVATDQLKVIDRRAAALRALGRGEDVVDRGGGAHAGISYEAVAHFNRGVSLWALEKHREAIESYEKAWAANHPGALSMLAFCRLTLAEWAQVGELTRKLIDSIPDGTFVDPFLSIALGLQPADQMKAAATAMRYFVPVAPKRIAHSNVTHAGKLRIAYLSGDFRRHPVGVAVAELLERHDRTRFEIVGVSIGPDDGSGTRARIVKSFDRFHDVASDTDGSIAKLLNDLHVHIAIDLNGLSGGCRPGILAHSPAPIQVSYLGYAGTTSADFIDYILADETVLPLDQQPFFTEKIVHLPDCFFANDATRRIWPRVPTRSDVGLPDEGFVFCCFNKSYKITAPIFDVWMRLLAYVPGSVLWLSDLTEPVHDNLRREAAARGIDPDRLIFAPRLGQIEDHLARHHAADLFLDTLPYNAHATASDALWAGLPVVTCAGGAFAGRVGASMLAAAGLPELVTHSLEDYEALALALATDPVRLSSIRRKLAASKPTCPLFDSDRFRRHIEAAYTTMWDIFRRGESPRSFRVEPNAATSGALT